MSANTTLPTADSRLPAPYDAGAVFSPERQLDRAR